MNTRQDYDYDHSGPLTMEGIRKYRYDIESLVCQIIRHYDLTFGIRLNDWPGDALAEHNAMVRRCWRELARLSAWAGSTAEMFDDDPDRPRAEFIAVCNRLFAEIEPGARAAALEVMVHNQDGITVSYTIEAGNADIIRVIHTADHEGCTEITTGEES